MSFSSMVNQIPRLGDIESGRHNNLDLIRLIAAAMVILSHSYVLLNKFNDEPMKTALSFGDLGGTAVYIFFFISGYLILKSCIRSSPINYMRARLLRIFPALVVVTLAAIFILGPIETDLPIRDYFSSSTTWNYLMQAILHRNYGVLPHVFTDGHHSPAVNQSLWTLASEWTLYTVILLTYVAFKAVCDRSPPSPMTWVVLVLAIAFTAQMMPLPWKHAIKWFAFAALGSGAYLARRWIPVSIFVAAAFLAIDLALIRLVPPLGKAAFPFALGYAIIVFGFHKSLHIPSFHKLGDYSYGLYIFGWPSQQMVIPFIGDSPLLLCLAALPIALFFAVLSWHFVERPALSLKTAPSGARSTLRRKNLEAATP